MTTSKETERRKRMPTSQISVEPQLSQEPTFKDLYVALQTQTMTKQQDFIRRLSAVHPSEKIDNLNTKLPTNSSFSKVQFILHYPEKSRLGWVVHNSILLVLLVDTAIIISGTLDGPRYRGYAKAYPYLPTEDFYRHYDFIFTLFYIVEFLIRSLCNIQGWSYWKSRRTWNCILAILPFIIIQLFGITGDSADDMHLRDRINLLKLCRLLRIADMCRVYTGMQIMMFAVSESIRPLKIALFFLITIVMIFATGIFLAEPCQDLSTCTFTDIFNAGYFLMVTVSTVGYGSQVPSLRNYGSLTITVIAMVFGTLYLAMPLAIIGNNYQITWRGFIYATSVSNGSSSERRALDIQDIDKVYDSSYVLCDRVYRLLDLIAAAHSGIEQIKVDRMVLLSYSSRKSMEKVQSLQGLTNEMDPISKVCISLLEISNLHRIICVDLTSSIPKELQMQKSKLARRNSSLTNRNMQAAVFGTVKRLTNFALNAALVQKKPRHTDRSTLRSIIWEIFAHYDFSQQAKIINHLRFYMTVVNILIFYFQTTPELQLTGYPTLICRKLVEMECKVHNDPGCFVYLQHGSMTSIPINFSCNSGDDSDTCYGRGYNFGSPNFTYDCRETFPSGGICGNRSCTSRADAISFDMEPYWVYPEFIFGIFFTIEMFLRAYSHPKRRNLWKNGHLILDFVCLLPFYVEIWLMLNGITPLYSIIPTKPTLLVMIRLLKTLRILKIGTHIRGTAVLTQTIKLVFQRLLIPISFLFLGCVVFGAVMYETERGTDCRVGNPNGCHWRNRNVLTADIAGNLPMGKRLMIQNKKTTIVTDMLRSTWFAVATFSTVGYGDIVPRTSIGRTLVMIGVVFGACYVAMPLSLIGQQYFSCYKAYEFDYDSRRKRTSSSYKRTRLSARAEGASRIETFESALESVHAMLDATDSDDDNIHYKINFQRRSSVTHQQLSIVQRFVELKVVFRRMRENVDRSGIAKVRKISVLGQTLTQARSTTQLRDDLDEVENVVLQFSTVIEQILSFNKDI